MMNPALANAIANPAQFKMPDPMEQMGGFLTNALMMEKIQSGRQERMDNALMNESWKAGGGDRAKVQAELVTRGGGRHIPGMMKQLAEADHKQAEVGKVGADAMKQALENLNQVLPLVTQQDYASVMSKDPIIGPQLMTQGLTPEKLSEVITRMTPEQFGQLKQQQMIGAKESLKKNYHLVSEKNGQALVAVNEYGAPNTTVAGTYGPKPVSAGTTVNVNGEKAISEFDKAVGKARGERFTQLEEAAQTAPQMIGEIDRALGILGGGKVILGAGSQALLDIARVAKAFGMPIENESMVNTEELSRFFAQNTLSNIARFKQMGVSLTPMSDSDRRLVEQASAQGTNDPVTIKRLLLIQRKMAQDSITKYNEMATRYTSNPATAPGQTALSTTPVPMPGNVPQPPQLPGSGQPPGPPAVPGAPGVKPKSSQQGFQKNVELLRSKKVTAAEFDKKYGPGAAAQVLGGAPTGGAPFPQ